MQTSSLGVVVFVTTAGCSSAPVGPATSGTGGSTSSAESATATTVATTAASAASTSGSGSATSSATTGSGMTPPTAAQLQALTTQCNQVSNGFYKMSGGGTVANIPICQLTGAVFWTSGMAVDCDGKTTAQCNINADPDYQNQTSATDSMGNPLDAANLPYVVIPLPSSRFDYGQHQIQLGQIVVVLYGGKLTYGVFGDEGPSTIIGEASYGMAASLGIDPNPSTRGTSDPVTYIVFQGSSAVASPIEDHAATVTKGEGLAEALVLAN